MRQLGLVSRLALVTLPVATTLVGAGCTPQVIGPTGDRGGDRDGGVASDAGGGVDTLAQMCQGPRKSLGASSTFIVNGTRTPSVVPLSAAQREAVVSIYGLGACSGSLIASRVVLTAKHCTVDQNGNPLSAGNFVVYFGQYDNNPTLQLGVTSVVNHSTDDLAMLVLEAAPSQSITVAPIPINVEQVTSAWIDRTVEAAGYGLTDPSTQTSDGRYFVAEPIYEVYANMLAINGEGIHGVCFGDSGGPVMGTASSGDVRVLGALSNGDASCTGIDRFTRTDPFVSWIEQTTGPTPGGGPVTCGTVTEVGHCINSGDAVEFCQNNELAMVDCSTSNQICGWSAANSGYRCVARGSDPCQGVDAYGLCDGTVSMWCAQGQLRQFDCALCQMTCGLVNESIGYDCQQDGCGGLDYLGRCTGNLAEWCENGQIQSVDCMVQYGVTCGWVDGTTGYYCQ